MAANRLSPIPATVLQSLTQLRSLDLSNNPLTAFHRDTLASTKQLVSLNVSGTRLTRLLPNTLRPASDTLSVVDVSRCGQLIAAPDADDVAALTRLHRLLLPARTCRCDVINFRSLVDDLRSRQRPRPSLYCGDGGVTVSAAVDIDTICSDTLTPTASIKPGIGARPLPSVPRSSRSDDPLPYNPMLGWYTAAVLSGLLFAFIACVGLEKAEKHLLEKCVSRQADKTHLDHFDQRRQSAQYQHARTSASICTVADFGVGVDSYLDTETSAT